MGTQVIRREQDNTDKLRQKLGNTYQAAVLGIALGILLLARAGNTYQAAVWVLP